jgi:sugar phosphate permease
MGYSIAFGFFKFINYAMFFWLPFFLSLHFDPQSANVISSLYSVGMMPGGVIVGIVSDMFGGRRACVIAVFMSILAPLLWVFAMYSDVMNPILLLFLLGLMGILVGGPNNIITSAVAADLAEEAVKLGLAAEKPTGTITGIINGSGSITAAFGLMLIGPLQGLGGWTAVWYFLIACVCAGTGLMSPKILKEIAE